MVSEAAVASGLMAMKRTGRLIIAAEANNDVCSASTAWKPDFFWFLGEAISPFKIRPHTFPGAYFDISVSDMWAHAVQNPIFFAPDNLADLIQTVADAGIKAIIESRESNKKKRFALRMLLNHWVSFFIRYQEANVSPRVHRMIKYARFILWRHFGGWGRFVY